MSLLGFMAAGGATAYRDVSNAQVEQANKIESAIFSAELADVYAQRVEQRRATQEQATYERDRGDKLSDRDVDREFKTADDEAAHKRALSLQEQRDAAAMKRAQLQDSGATKRSGILAEARKSGRGAKDGDTSKIQQQVDKLSEKRLSLISKLDETRGRDTPHAKALREELERVDRSLRAAKHKLLESGEVGFNRVPLPTAGPPRAATQEEMGAAVRGMR